MIKEIVMDKLPNNAQEVKIIKINKKGGDNVNINDIIFEVEGKKGTNKIKSTAEGKVKSILVSEGDVVKIGDVLARVDEGKLEEKKNNYEDLPEVDLSYLGSLLKPKKEQIEADITIIGGGPGGYVAAIRAAQHGAKVVLVEKDKIGGTCLNRGCIPTKSFVRSAQVFENLKNAEEYGCHTENVNINMKRVVDRKNDVVSKLIHGIHYLFDKHNIKFVKGEGKILNKNTVIVNNSESKITIKTQYIIIATGSESAVLPIPGADNKNVIYSREALELETLPKKMVIVGGGVIGMEFAFIFNTFGVDVTVIEYLDNILDLLDEDISRGIAKIAREKGIKIYTGAKVVEISQSEDGESIVIFSKYNQKKYVSGNKVLLSVGRKPYFKGLGIENISLEFNDKGRGIKVNDKMQTNIPNIYAIGDVTSKLQLAHVASHQGIIAVDNIMGIEKQIDYRFVPSAIFTNPEVAIVGVNEKIAKEQENEVEIARFPFSANGKALTLGEDRGLVKLIKEKESGKILGGTIIGPHATDLIAEITLAAKNELKVSDIVETIHAHPTTSEAIHEAALELEKGAIHFTK